MLVGSVWNGAGHAGNKSGPGHRAQDSIMLRFEFTTPAVHQGNKHRGINDCAKTFPPTDALNIPHAKGGEATENGTSEASRPRQNVAGTHVPQVLASGPHLMHEIGSSRATQYCGLSTPRLQHEGTIMEL